MKKRNIGGIIAICMSMFMLFFSNMDLVSAASNPSTKAEFKKYYGISYDKNNETGKINITAKRGEFKVTVDFIDLMSGVTTTEYELTKDKAAQIPFSATNAGNIKITVTSTKAYIMNNKKEYFYKEMNEYSIKGNATLVNNTHYNDVCKEYRDTAAAESREATVFFQEQLNYCYSQNVTSNIKKSTLKNTIKEIKTLWGYKKLMLSDNIEAAKNSGGSPIDLDAGESAVRKVGKLQCDPYTDTNEDKFFTTQTTKISDKKGKEVCQVDCVEELTVTYSPPSAVKAGLCFEYTVTVRSKVSCQSTVSIDPPVRETVCTPTPVCNSRGDWFAGPTGAGSTQSGPTDDFDDCVAECDGGTYSQSCINKCYKKVYGTSTKAAKDMSNMLAYEDSVSRTADSCDARLSSLSNGYSGAQIMEALQESGTGKYVRNGKTISWKAGSCYWDKIGRFYMQTSEWANFTVNTLRNGMANSSGSILSYYINNEGFKAGYHCGETCVWTGCSNGESLNESDADTKYYEDLQDYNAIVAQCTSYDYCFENTATFDMSVTTSSAGKITFGPSTNTPNKKPTDPVDGAGIIKDQGGICYGSETSDGDHYKTVINFPGTWINYKTGEIIYKEPEPSQETWYKKEADVFCTALDEKDVNVKWWVWKMRNKDNLETAPEKDSERDQSIKSSIEENITAKISNFGRYKWSIEIGCFYAVYNQSCATDTLLDNGCPTTPSGGTGNSEGGSNQETITPATSTEIENYQFRIVSLDDMFPSSSGASTAGGTAASSSNVGFNWTPLATNVNNSAYAVAPAALIANIQTASNTIYDEANKGEYLDYEIILDKETIKNIRSNYKSTYAVFGDEPSDYEKTNGITSYKSRLISELRQNGKATKTGLIGCNNEAGGQCLTE